MYALFFFWFPYCRDKIVAFGAFRCGLHLSGGIRPYVKQASAASWAPHLFHRVFIFFRNHFPPSFGCLCRKGTGQIIPVPFSFVIQGREGSPVMPFFASPYLWKNYALSLHRLILFSQILYLVYHVIVF